MSQSSQTPVTEPVASWALLHCPLLTSTVLGVGLCHIEKLLDSPNSARTQPKKRATKKQKTNTPFDDDYDDYAGPSTSTTASGIGFAGAANDDHSWVHSNASRQKIFDKEVTAALEQLRPYIPDEGRSMTQLLDGKVTDCDAQGQDFMIEVSVLAHLRRRFLPIASILLQTQSIADMSGRTELYTELIQWFASLSKHAGLSTLVAQPIMRVTKAVPRLGKSEERDVTYNASPGPRQLVETVVKQTLTLKGSLDKAKASRPKSAKPVVEEVKLLAFCDSILASVEAIDRALVMCKGKAFVNKLLASIRGEAKPSSSSVTDGAEAAQAEYDAWSRSLNYAECDMRMTTQSGTFSYQHVFAKEAEATAPASSKRTLYIAKEMAQFQPSLPSGIFVRVDESRMDLLKVLIIGPDVSPYRNGTFLFDFFLPQGYPQVPPMGKIVSTGGGKCRFNPNLYAEGKICLSLLGTWAGPGWMPWQSTLLQVFLSITALIMATEDPCVNEPGWTNRKGTPFSTRYNKNLRRQTVHLTMLEMLKNPPAPWEDVIRGHFKLKKAEIKEQLDLWVKEDDKQATHGDGARYISSYPGAASATTTGNDLSEHGESKRELRIG